MLMLMLRLRLRLRVREVSPVPAPPENIVTFRAPCIVSSASSWDRTHISMG